LPALQQQWLVGRFVAAVTVRWCSRIVQAAGTKVMPHLGQLPGCGLRTSGCIGQVYWVALAATGWGEVGVATALGTFL